MRTNKKKINLLSDMLLLLSKKEWEWKSFFFVFVQLPAPPPFHLLTYLSIYITEKLKRTTHHHHLYRTTNQIVLEHQGHGNKNEIKQKHCEAESLVHFPPETGDRHDDKQQHHEEDRYGAHHAHRVHLHGLPVNNSV